MDYKFLHKVVDQLVYETEIDYDMGEIQFPSYPDVYSPPSFPSFVFPPFFFSDHCEDVYGLNNEEIEYVWEEYKRIINDKIGNNG